MYYLSTDGGECYIYDQCYQAWHYYKYTTKKNIRSSYEIEDFVETHLCKLYVILRSRVLLGVCPHEGYISATTLGTTL